MGHLASPVEPVGTPELVGSATSLLGFVRR